VAIVNSPGRFKRLQVEELERILGLQAGDTTAPGLQPEWSRTTLRWTFLGDRDNVSAMAHILNGSLGHQGIRWREDATQLEPELTYSLR